MLERQAQLPASSAGKHAFLAVRPPPLWIVVADTHVVKIFAEGGDEDREAFRLVYKLRQPDLKIDNMDNSGKGRNRSNGSAFHAYEPAMQESRQAETALSRKVAAWLLHEFSQKRFGALALVAGPQMLGDLRRDLDARLRDIVVSETPRHLTGIGGPGLTHALKGILHASVA